MLTTTDPWFSSFWTDELSLRCLSFWAVHILSSEHVIHPTGFSSIPTLRYCVNFIIMRLLEETLDLIDIVDRLETGS